MNRQTLQYTSRKTLLRPTGVEYGDYAMNHVVGCAHGCNYPCYAYLMAKRFGQVKSYNEWCGPKLVSNTIDILAKEIPKLKHKIKNVQLCFTTDPFQYGYPEIAQTSILAICRLNDAGIKCSTLTKGITPDMLSYHSIVEAEKRGLKNEYGITLVSLDHKFWKRYEPGTADPGARVLALENLHRKGCKTWVSIEPFPTPNIVPEDLLALLKTVSFTDKIIFGRWNYNSLTGKFKDHKAFYNSCVQTVRKFCEENEIECIIKQGTETA